MFRIVMTAAWAVLLIVVLYLWADVREVLAVVKDAKRELLRSNLSARAAESFPNFGKEARETREAEGQQEAEEQIKAPGKSLDPREEQVLNEVLTEFLG